MISHPDEIAAAPGRMQASDQRGIEGYGMVDLGFYQHGQRLALARQMQVEFPLYEGHALAEDQEVEAFQMSAQDARWAEGPRARVRTGKLVVNTQQDEWIAAATALPTTGCVKGHLSAGGEQAANTTIRAARGRGLSMIQAETAADGSFCLPVTQDDDWRVSSFFSNGRRSFGLRLNLRSDQAAGMCGGLGCKDVGAVALPELP